MTKNLIRRSSILFAKRTARKDKWKISEMELSPTSETQVKLEILFPEDYRMPQRVSITRKFFYLFILILILFSCRCLSWGSSSRFCFQALSSRFSCVTCKRFQIWQMYWLAALNATWLRITLNLGDSSVKSKAAVISIVF